MKWYGQSRNALPAKITLPYPELAEIAKLGTAKSDLTPFLTQLAESKGAEYAYDVLKQAPFLPNVDMHLMGHAIGDILYKQQGVEGIKVCTQDFRNACSHSIVVGLYLEEGEAALPKIVETCRQAPGGSGAYTMCFHGLGHGILAATGYDFKKTVSICAKTTGVAHGRESTECIGGSVMEILGGGFHDKDAWLKERTHLLSNSDPLLPCSSTVIPVSAKAICYIYLTPRLFELAGASLAKPTEDHFSRAFDFCDQINKANVSERNACYGGFGKEFVVLAKERDIRNIEKMTDQELEKVYNWCLLTKSPDGIEACLMSAFQSLFWGGENDAPVSIRFCSRLGEYENKCFTQLFEAADFYYSSRDRKVELCNKSPVERHVECKNKLGLN